MHRLGVWIERGGNSQRCPVNGRDQDDPAGDIPMHFVRGQAPHLDVQS